MARGWESKAVEQQQEEAASKTAATGVSLTPEQLATEHRRQTLLLSRQQVLQQLQVACHPRHRQMLESALADLDVQLAR